MESQFPPVPARCLGKSLGVGFPMGIDCQEHAVISRIGFISPAEKNADLARVFIGLGIPGDAA